MDITAEHRTYRHKGWEYILFDAARTAWISRGHIGRCRRYRVPDHVTVDGLRYTIVGIGADAFKCPSTLRRLVIPDSILHVDFTAFYSCRNLRSVFLGRDVESIDSWYFHDCLRLTNLEISKDNPHMQTANNLVLTGDGKEVLRTCRHCATYVVPEGVEHICDGALRGIPRLTHVHMPESLQVIGIAALSHNPQLRRAKVPEGVRCIAHQCFWKCENLEYVELPSTLDEVGRMVFCKCPHLKSLVLWSDSVVEGSKASLDLAFGDLPADCFIYVPYNLVEDYSVDEFWGRYTIRICQVGGRYDCDYDGPLDAEPEGDLIDMKMQLHQAFHEFLDCRKAHPSAPKYRRTQLMNGYESIHYDLEQWRKDEPDAEVFALLDAVVRMRDAVDLKIMHLNRRGESPDMQGKIWV